MLIKTRYQIKICQSYMRATTKTEQSTTFHHGSGAEPRWMNTFHMLPSKFLTGYTTEVMKNMWFEERDNDNADMNNDREGHSTSAIITTD